MLEAEFKQQIEENVQKALEGMQQFQFYFELCKEIMNNVDSEDYQTWDHLYSTYKKLLEPLDAAVEDAGWSSSSLYC